ncbi:MAG: glycosyltransferase family 2 protein [Actinomycetota bacterium]|nr:glycosyltransferase family 2 protein [Actinomycetota bacterium]
MRLVRFWGSRRPPTSDGVTVVVASWNTKAILEVTLAAVRRFSPPDTEILVIDNHSSDGSREWLRQRPFGVRPVLLPFNIHHGRGLDLGFALARTSVVITMDSDAFPYSDKWLETMLRPMANAGAVAAGMWGRRGRLHPACAAYRRDDYFNTGLSFSPFMTTSVIERIEAPEYGTNIWDTGELVSLALPADRVVVLPTQDSRFGGWSMSDVAYHHGALSRLSELDDDQAAMSHEDAWHHAIVQFLGNP